MPLPDGRAISMIGSDSQAMGRICEVVLRTWQTAHVMKLRRGCLEGDGAADNLRARRYVTTGQVDAAFAANACARLKNDSGGTALEALAAELDDEYSARMPSPYLCETSRRLGRQLLRAATRIWTTPGIDAVSMTTGGAHQPVALGAVVAAAGGDATDAAALSFHHLTAPVTSAAVRLLGLDPIELAVVQERVGRESDGFRSHATRWASMAPAALPAWGGALTEILGEHHGRLDARMFVA